MALEARPPLFDSFWMGGFEAATHLNRSGRRLDLIAATQHDIQIDHDYAILRTAGLRTVRDAVRWHLIDRHGEYDFSSLAPMVAAAERHGVQVIWTLCHYGWPDDLDVFDKAFVPRFAAFAEAVARFIQANSKRVPSFCPVNEISFLSWAAGEVGWFHPFGQGRGGELKRRLVEASIAACDAIWRVDRRARIVHVDPLIHVVPPLTRPELGAAAAAQHESQYEASDMLCGIRDRELGGHPRYLDVMGLNYYHSNQWEFPDARLRWEDAERDSRWRPLHLMIAEVFDRYRCPLFLGETSHFGVGRAAWLRETAAEVWSGLDIGIPIEGICLFPVIDRMDWDNEHHWHNSGLWDIECADDGRLVRRINVEYAEELRHSQLLLSPKTLHQFESANG